MTSIQKRVAAGSTITTLSRDTILEHFVTVTPEGGEPPESLFQRAGDIVHGLDGRIISVESLGMSAGDRKSLPVLTAALGVQDAPLAWVENARTDNLCGVHMWLVSGTSVKALYSNGRRVGSMFEDGHAQYCRVVGLLPANAAAGRAEQTQTVLEQMDAILCGGGMAFSNVLRTWFYNDNILSWYGDFNAVRTRFFHEKGVFDGLLPASTGVGGRNSLEAALVSGLIAVKTENQDVRMAEVPSPLQPPACEYGSSFSRAVELKTRGLRRLFVSGTASIDKYGNTLFIDDPMAQVRQTMEVVHAILHSRQMDWGDVTRSLAYFKRAKDAPLFQEYRRQNRVPPFPAIIVENDICRDDLLFEIEVDALAVV